MPNYCLDECFHIRRVWQAEQKREVVFVEEIVGGMHQQRTEGV